MAIASPRLTALLAVLLCAASASTAASDPAHILADLPASIDASASYLIYLHPRIVEDQGRDAFSPEHGRFDFDGILDALARDGAVVIAPMRPRQADPQNEALRVLADIRALQAAGVPTHRITVVGASKGAYIASLVSHQAHERDLNVVLLAGCSNEVVAHMQRSGIDLHGNVLAIRDVADTMFAGSCAPAFAHSPGLRLRRELVLQVGSGHGILFSPLEAWLSPTLAWARGRGEQAGTPTSGSSSGAANLPASPASPAPP